MPVDQSFNMRDPKQEEAIRRGAHEWDPNTRSYKPITYIHQSYPRMMDHTPMPVRKEYKSDEEFSQAKQDWDDRLRKSIVHNKAEEESWLKEHEPAKKAIKVA